jgi:F-type H+-transporting ATPase subunit beta
MLGLEQLSIDDRNLVSRARRLERFLTQPFFSTEQFSGMKGKEVSLDDALDGCERILSDEFKDLPESAFYMIGTIDEAKKKENGSTKSEDGSQKSEDGSKKSEDGSQKSEVEKRTKDAKKDKTEAKSEKKPEKVLETQTK